MEERYYKIEYGHIVGKWFLLRPNNEGILLVVGMYDTPAEAFHDVIASAGMNKKADWRIKVRI